MSVDRRAGPDLLRDRDVGPRRVRSQRGADRVSFDLLCREVRFLGSFPINRITPHRSNGVVAGSDLAGDLPVRLARIVAATKLGDGRTSAYVITRAEVERVKAERAGAA